MIRIVTDSAFDMPADIAARLDITVIPIVVEIDGVSYREGVDLQREQFYADFHRYQSFKTAVPAARDFVDVYTRLIDQGATDILSIHLAHRYSSFCDAAQMAASMALQEAPAGRCRIQVIDSGTLTVGQGWIVMAAAEMARQGAGVADILARIDHLRPRAFIYAMADTVRYLRRGGRVSTIVGGIGELLQIKLLVEVRDGVVSQFDRVRTRNRGIEILVQAARSRQPLQRLAGLHSGGAADDVARLQSELSSLVPLAEQWVMPVTPVIGAHFGSRGVGVVLLTDV